MNKILRIIAVIVILVGLIFAGYHFLLRSDNEKEQTEIIKAKTQDTKESKETSLPVKAQAVSQGDLPLRLKISAVSDVWEKTMIIAEVGGKIEKINCNVGDWVNKGQLLVKIDDTEKQLDVESRKAFKLQTLSKFLVKESAVSRADIEMTDQQKQELEIKKNNYQKALKDLEKGLISEKNMDKIKNEYEELMIISGAQREEVLKATENLTDAIINLKKAELDLKRTEILSPFPGKIAEIKISQGQRINAGQETIKVVNLHSLYLKGFALESEYDKLKVGTRVRIKLDSFPDRYFYGILDAINPEIDSERKTIAIYVKVDNPDNIILPGMHAEIDIEYKVFKNVIKVPVNAVTLRQERYLVFMVRDNTALWVYVTVGEKNDEEWEIKGFENFELRSGDLVVTEGQLTLGHQSKVRVVQ